VLPAHPLDLEPGRCGGVDAHRAAAGPGLVYSSRTSQPRGVEVKPATLEMSCSGLRLQGMRRGVKNACRSIQEVALAGSGRCVPWLVTLTYAKVDGWGPKHVSEFLNVVRKWGARNGFEIPYVWVAEMQQRGAVHYHVIVWLPVRMTMPKADKAGWWRHGMSQRVRAKKAIGYLLKYASKGDAGAFPRGLRLYGYGGLTSSGRAVRYWLCLPGWVHLRARSFQRITRLPGGLWVQEETGEVWRSPYEFVRFDRDAQTVIFQKRIERPRSLDAA
jgi:hypothetical protein